MELSQTQQALLEHSLRIHSLGQRLREEFMVRLPEGLLDHCPLGRIFDSNKVFIHGKTFVMYIGTVKDIRYENTTFHLQIDPKLRINLQFPETGPNFSLTTKV